MFRTNKEPWVFNLTYNFAKTFFYISVCMYISFFVFSRQGLSISSAYYILFMLSMFCVVSGVLLFFSLIFSIIKKDSNVKKIVVVVKIIVNILVVISILVITNLIYVFSLGLME